GLARLGAGVNRLHRLLGVATIGDAPPRFLRALGFRPHVLHGRPSDAGDALGRQAQPGSRARLLHGRGIDRTGAWPLRGGLALRPFGVGGLGASAALPRPRLLFAISLAAAGTSVIVALLIRPAALKARHHDTGAVVPIGKLLTLHGFAAVMVSSVVTVTSLDL